MNELRSGAVIRRGKEHTSHHPTPFFFSALSDCRLQQRTWGMDHSDPLSKSCCSISPSNIFCSHPLLLFHLDDISRIVLASQIHDYVLQLLASFGVGIEPFHASDYPAPAMRCLFSGPSRVYGGGEVGNHHSEVWRTVL
jgi:hypothetical protein